MSAIITNYELTLKDGADPSTSTAAANLNADRYSEIIPLERSFMGEIHIHFAKDPFVYLSIRSCSIGPQDFSKS